MNSVEVRKATPADAGHVADCHDRCFKKTFSAQLLAGDLQPPDRAATSAQLHVWLLHDSGFDKRVATLDGATVGYCTVSGSQLVHLFVDPVHQGTGLGRRLLAVAETLLAASSQPTFKLHTRVENLNAIGFYEHTGWTVTDHIIRTVEHGLSYEERVLIKHRQAVP